MKWKKERDLLIAQTMAFVQSVAGKTREVGGRQAEGLEAEGRTGPIPLDQPVWDEPAAPGRPVEIAMIARPLSVRPSELREEIRGRVAAFRAHQELFNRDRDEFCNSVMAKLRTSTQPLSRTLDAPPAKH